MALDVTMTEHTDHLEVVVSGTYDMREAVDRFPSVIAACRRSRISRVLIDYRRMEGIPPATDEILYALRVGDQYDRHVAFGGHEFTLAYVGSATAVASTKQAGLKIAKEKNMRADTFTSVEEALEWLNVRPE